MSEIPEERIEEQLMLQENGESPDQGAYRVHRNIDRAVRRSLEGSDIINDLARVQVHPIEARSEDATEPERLKEYSGHWELEVYLSDGVRSDYRRISMDDTKFTDIVSGLQQFDQCDQVYETFVPEKDDLNYMRL